MLGTELRGKQLGLVGSADRASGGCARPGIRRASRILIRGVVGLPVPSDVARSAAEHVRHLSLHVPLTPETRHLIDKKALARMKRTAYLINTARGPVVDEAALAWALQQRLIAGAALDVYEHEPADPPGSDPARKRVARPASRQRDNETRTAMADLAAETLWPFSADAHQSRRSPDGPTRAPGPKNVEPVMRALARAITGSNCRRSRRFRGPSRRIRSRSSLPRCSPLGPRTPPHSRPRPGCSTLRRTRRRWRDCRCGRSNG